jgi:peptidoglycan hydrolase CwlO-like protein
MTTDAIISLVGQLAAEGLSIISASIAASQEQLAVLDARLRDSLAALQGARDQVHAEVDARTQALRDEIAALKESAAAAAGAEAAAAAAATKP